MISIIITVYNKADCVRKCIESVRNQSMEDVDIVVVDDGSTDNSAEIIDLYAKEDGRIQAVHKKNGGETSARKAGIEKAKGDYILFVDADDWIDRETASILVSKAEEYDADVVTGDWVIHYNKSENLEIGNMPEGVYKENSNKVEFANHMIFCGDVKKNGINASLNTKLFRKELISHMLGELPDGMVYAEDDFVSYATMALASCVVVTHEPFYHYIMKHDSISHSTNEWYLRDLNQGYMYFKKMVRNISLSDSYLRQIEIYMQRAVLYGMSKYLDFQEEASISWYRYDESNIPIGSRIVIYGAGKVGQCYYRQFRRSTEYTLVAWVDQQYDGYRKNGYDVEPVDRLKEYSFDYIIVAVASKGLAESIIKNLSEKYRLDTNKIRWEEPRNDMDDNLSFTLE